MTEAAILRSSESPSARQLSMWLAVAVFINFVDRGNLATAAPVLARELHLSATQKGFLLSVPLLAGSIFRPLMGALADRIGGKNTGLIGLTLTLTPLLAGWLWATELQHFYTPEGAADFVNP